MELKPVYTCVCKSVCVATSPAMRSWQNLRKAAPKKRLRPSPETTTPDIIKALATWLLELGTKDLWEALLQIRLEVTVS